MYKSNRISLKVSFFFFCFQIKHLVQKDEEKFDLGKKSDTTNETKR